MQNAEPGRLFSAQALLHSSFSLLPSGGWWPARVTLPVQRIKSPLHHFNACRPKWCSRQDSHLHWRRSRPRVSALGLSERTGWSLLPVPLRRDFLTKEACGLPQGGEVVAIPSAALGGRAHETCLSAGSTATLPDEKEWGPHPELHQAGLLTEQAHRSKCFGGAEIGRRETTCTSKAA